MALLSLNRAAIVGVRSVSNPAAFEAGGGGCLAPTPTENAGGVGKSGKLAWSFFRVCSCGDASGVSQSMADAVERIHVSAVSPREHGVS
ncbi:MAG: hypothetical protein Q4B35_07155 [Slackia sp.]|nr:hypothetical protein [Slackia sp.]